MIKLATGALILGLVCHPVVAAAGEGNSGACEKALQLLVTKLEANGEFSEANRVDALPDAESDYSPCLIPAEDVRDPDAKTYIVYRHSDDVTIFVYREPVVSSTFVCYGPFFSAYRK